ncbi:MULTISPECIES: Heat-labile enterotoxin IIA, B chain [Cronobacter]|uniref:Heat-labile enterotoxin IIA, B chain n=1 Tax=Cronobacter TaxID=413496 RepID=UPI000D0A8EED|nr:MULTISPECIES: Heat-labile enterotoxin IIA, B chain [Cronobacter]EJH4501915.1 Heat-labile enterotoxin IIA, B chain [Cronobacter sakazakii]EJV9474763.1 Heat-labile enterotoxin IIA, B chain [Cronobacter sakazakii]ELY6202311.1 Heat-labile enterotoxin IIA, B chain [Cronobacter malonaticus]ELY6256186.1 Heat-labile enterotoxin IIA, B chain [Cronobacter malonaticus]NCG99788.1 Heat-labile enterotoxin IIA, B chain [Cronobacter malonaticus]
MKIVNLFKATCVAMGLVSLTAHAGASNEFRKACQATSGTLWEEQVLTKYSADTNTKHKGMYVVSESGNVWRIPGAQYYPENAIIRDANNLAMLAVISGVPVSICSTTKTTPNEVWSIELG